MGNTNSVHKISFKQMQTIIQNKDYIIINKMLHKKYLLLIILLKLIKKELLLYMVKIVLMNL
jgi:hypothetical protein